mgnify:FL=1
MTTISVSYDEPLEIGDLLTYGDVFGRQEECHVTDVLANGVYCIENARGKTNYVKRARHQGGIENKIYVFVQRGKSGRWKREQTGAADEWVFNARRNVQ